MSGASMMVLGIVACLSWSADYCTVSFNPHLISPGPSIKRAGMTRPSVPLGRIVGTLDTQLRGRVQVSGSSLVVPNSIRTQLHNRKYNVRVWTCEVISPPQSSAMLRLARIKCPMQRGLPAPKPSSKLVLHHDSRMTRLFLVATTKDRSYPRRLTYPYISKASRQPPTVQPTKNSAIQTTHRNHHWSCCSSHAIRNTSQKPSLSTRDVPCRTAWFDEISLQGPLNLMAVAIWLGAALSSLRLIPGAWAFPVPC